MATVISFIGKGRRSVERDGSSYGYSTTQYLFNGTTKYETSFLGKEIANHLSANRLILIGTVSSSWDMLLEGYRESDDESLNLLETVEQGNITEGFLEGYSQRFASHLGCAVQCILIDYAKDETTQATLLLRLNAMLSENEEIAIDVTHSFRHLPMLALVASRYLKKSKNIGISDIYYGAYEMKDSNDITPVISLKGMLNMLDWVDGLTSYDKDGDFSVFSQLFSNEGFNKESLKKLNKAAFYERITSPNKAVKYFDSTVQAINQHSSPIFDLFKQTLINRMSWRKKPTQAERELEIAKNYLEKRDFIRATIYLFEALITKSIPTEALKEELKWGGVSYELRTQYKSKLMSNRDFYRLNALRNALAHGDIEKGEDSIQTLLSDENALFEQLQNWLINLPKVIKG